MLPDSLLRFRQPIIIALHLVLISVGYALAFWLRFEGNVSGVYATLFWTTLPILLVIRMASLWMFGMHQGWWRYAGVKDLVNLVQAITISTVVFVAALWFTGLLQGFPRSVPVIDWGVAIILLGGVRLGVRALRESRGWTVGAGDRRAPSALVVGAGEGAERLIRLVRQGAGDFRPIGLVDDDPLKRGMRLHGIPVIGTTSDIPRLVKDRRVKLLVIAIPSSTRQEMKRIVDLCMEAGVEFKIVPSLRELLDGSARATELRKVQIEDLLGRDSIQLEMETIRGELEGRVAVVTGAAGSIGSELARQIAASNPRRLILVEQAESPLYFLDLELRKRHPNLEIVPIVSDVTNQPAMRRLFSEYRPDHVYHAAAYKHVPLMEMNITEAVRNNVFGTLNVALAAAEFGTDKFVLISTDKAVRPSSIMGATKRIAERIVLGWPELQRASTDFRAVRFGNVLGSDGSVIPLFRKQLAAGGPITVTHPDVTRYFMTIPEAVQLVLQAASLPEAGDRITMLEMGEPVRIVDLAENLIRLSGLEPYKEMPIVFSGLRPGEKLFEELMSDVEETVGTRVEKIRVVQTDETDPIGLRSGLDRLATAIEIGNANEIICSLCAFVPECVSPLKELHAEALQRNGVGEQYPMVR